MKTKNTSKRKKAAVEVWYSEEGDILALVEPSGKIWKYLGDDAPALFKVLHQVNTWYEAKKHPRLFRTAYAKIGTL